MTATFSGQGAVYIRVSTDHQDTERQYEAVKRFLSENRLSIDSKRWFEDKAFRDNEARPDFRRLLSLAEKGAVNWIVVDSTERFAMKSSKRFVGLLGELEEWQCKLFTVDGKEWTEGEIATEVQALIKGHESHQEGVSRSYRVLGKQALMGREGLYLGGYPPFGFDVATFPSKDIFDETWRVIWQPERGRQMRIKQWPDGTEERWDGKGNMPPIGMDEVRRLIPSRSPEKLDVIREVFQKYAEQRISFNALAGLLNSKGYRAGGGALFTATHMPEMLSQPAYFGTPGWNRRHVGKFYGWTNGKQTRMVKPTTADGNGAHQKVEKTDWILSETQWYDPIIENSVWNKVQEKLNSRVKLQRVPRSPNFIFSGLLICGSCGQPMAGGNRRMRDGRREPEYYCSTYHRWVSGGQKEKCSCRRHTIKQSEILSLVGSYLEDVQLQLNVIEEVQRTGDLSLLEPYKKNLIELAKEEKSILSRMITYCFPTETCFADKEQMEFRLGFFRLMKDKFHRDPVGFEELLIEFYNQTFARNNQKTTSTKEKLEARLIELAEKYRELPSDAPRTRQLLQDEIVQVEKELDETEKMMERLTDRLYQLDDEIFAVRGRVRGLIQSLSKDLTDNVCREQAEAVGGLIKTITCSFSAVDTNTQRKSGQTRRQSAIWTKIKVVPNEGSPVEIKRGCNSNTHTHVRTPDRG